MNKLCVKGVVTLNASISLETDNAFTSVLNANYSTNNSKGEGVKKMLNIIRNFLKRKALNHLISANKKGINFTESEENCDIFQSLSSEDKEAVRLAFIRSLANLSFEDVLKGEAKYI